MNAVVTKHSRRTWNLCAMNRVGYLLRIISFILVLFSNPLPAVGENQTGAGAPYQKSVRTVIVADYYPYTFVNSKGYPDGFTVDLAKAVTRVMGMELEIGVVPWDLARRQLKGGDIDFLPMMAYSKKRDIEFDFSAPHTIAYDAFFTRNEDRSAFKSMNDLKGKRVIVMKDDQAHDYLLSSGLVEARDIILAESLPDCLRFLSSGKGDASLMPKLVGLMLMKDLKLGNLAPSPVVVNAYNRPFSFAVKDGNLPLLERLSQGLSIVKKTGEYKNIYEKWFGPVEPYGLTLKTALKYVLAPLLVLFLAGSAFALWSFSLKRQVTARTRSLEEEVTERRRAEEALKQVNRELRASEKKFRSLIRKVPAAIVLHDRQGSILDSNPLAQQLLGFSEDQLRSKKLIDPEWCFLREDGSVLPVEEYPVSLVLSGGKPLRNNVTGIHRPDRDHISWMLVSADPDYDHEGNIVQVIVSFVDITKLKAAERSVALLSFALDNVCEAAFLIDENACFRYVNEGSCRKLQYTREELMGMGVPDVDPDFPLMRWPGHWDELKRRGSLTFEGRHRAKGGTIIPVEISTNYIEYDGQGYNLALVRDITERKHAERKRDEQLHFLQQLLDSIPIPVYYKDLDGFYLGCNTAFETLMCIPRSDIVGKTAFELLPKERAEIHHEADLALLRHHGVQIYEVSGLYKDGKYHDVVFNKATFVDEDNRVAGIVCAAVEVTERKKAEEALLKLNEELEQRVQERTAEIEAKNRELERMNRLFVGRERRMAELKERIRELEGNYPIGEESDESLDR
jgi:PAS domain S-box-containing protein